MQILDNAFLVTGAGSGLGAATAKMIADEGGKVVIADVAQAGEQVAKELGAKGRYVKCDVTEESSMQAAVDECVASFGAIHGLVNCAGVAPGERVVGRNGPHSLASFQRAVMVNLVGTFNAIRLAAARMSVQPAFANGERGVIVNTSSVASFEGQVGQAAYSASKAGVNGMTLPVARELAKFGIRVMTIAPGIFDTPMLRGMSEEVRASLGQQVPFPARLGRPEEYASLVREIIANEVLNGAVIRLDGAIRMAAK
ncbi:MAG TPA: 3-hydroxyacyl-CoA dehydrogenase [Usitatibacter sp.]|nr:3-hydroxyacyl-CoA dehydrogenase [Usitatibacter sp.]